jgi:SecD/SecF fusion protein
MSDRQRHSFVLLLVAGLIAASIAVLATNKTVLGLDLRGGVELVYQAEPTAQSQVNQTALNRAVDIMRSRVDQLGVSEPEIQTSGNNLITVGLPDVTDTERAKQEVGQTAQLLFYDWEPNVINPSSDRSVASQLQTQDPTALELSQGVGTSGPGLPGTGGQPLYQAVVLAAKQTPQPKSTTLGRLGQQWYMFGAPGSAACATAAKDAGTKLTQGQHCLLAGPTTFVNATHADALRQMDGALPKGVSASQAQLLIVPQGTILLQAANPSASDQIAFSNPDAQFFVLHDHVALTGNDITDPVAATDQTGSPDVSFGFSGQGQSKFSAVTRTIAHRGETVSGPGQSLNQHFAVALSNIVGQLLTVPQIDFRTYPDGITGGGGADITGGFTQQSASDLANLLRLGALPVNLKLISENQVSATLGAQALHDGLIAGAIGLLIVVLFLLVYYRVLGLIATLGLAVYGLYFYALIKLIPITLTLAGIAGLILTIGVAADANIVIFERVKEEIRAGRSIKAGIATGYKKGLTAIIDANVVTIMTAFILFVLATAEVQGFAFTLGVGVIVSLFTAVVATQAILMSMGDSRTIARPSALGAGKRKREWRFDFMGASKYFFSMSGVILLIGALAIGGRGLNLGIDFTSGSRITAALERPATATQVATVAGHSGARNPVVQKVTDPSLGKAVFQISSKSLGKGGQNAVKVALDDRFGVKSFDATLIGPTFGRTIANSAVVAIIASLLVISAYVALRFEWKFAVPVLVALMHDLLITSGVYALTGKEVTVDTVAALLTILGYSMYDTIIVFDRVRENIPRMPRAAFSQIVNRSMSEVLTRSIATTSCTLLPILALLLFGGSSLQDFAFALLIGVASGAYSSIFIASPVLTHWKERELTYRHRRERIVTELGAVPAYAAVGSDVEPLRERVRRRAGRLTEPDPEGVSSSEFEQMKRDLDIEREPTRHTSRLSRRLAHSSEPADGQQPPPQRGGRRGQKPKPPARKPPAARPGATPPAAEPKPETAAPETEVNGGSADAFERAPDIAENDGIAPVNKAERPSRPRPRGRRHGRPR